LKYELSKLKASSSTQTEKFTEVNDIQLDPFYSNMLLCGSRNGYASVFAIDCGYKENSPDNNSNYNNCNNISAIPKAHQQNVQFFSNEITSVNWSNNCAGFASYVEKKGWR
jgi:hypothetical protein